MYFFYLINAALVSIRILFQTPQKLHFVVYIWHKICESTVQGWCRNKGITAGFCATRDRQMRWYHQAAKHDILGGITEGLHGVWLMRHCKFGQHVKSGISTALAFRRPDSQSHSKTWIPLKTVLSLTDNLFKDRCFDIAGSETQREREIGRVLNGKW